jgi:Zn-dependent metalloprotease
MLEEVARRGSAEQRDWALRNLAVDTTTRSLRATTQLMAPPARFALLAPVAAKLKRTIYTAEGGTSLPGKVVRNEGGAATGDPAEDEAYDYLGNTFDFYWKTYNRNSIDDHGLPLDATVHFGQRYNNAFWNGQQMVFGDGDGVIFNRFTIDVDVVGHELTHGVTGSEVNLVYLGQSGALNESVSDVFGIMIKQYALGQDSKSSDWLIGAQLLKVPPPGQALRSMKAPGTAYNNSLLGKDPQPAKMSDYVNTGGDNGGVHINSGIPNHAFFLVATNLGGKPWERAGQIWYDTIRDKQLQANATFSDFAARTVINAGHRYGTNSAEQKAVKDAWKAVEVQ